LKKNGHRMRLVSCSPRRAPADGNPTPQHSASQARGHVKVRRLGAASKCACC
jgi:hypothetical protein